MPDPLCCTLAPLANVTSALVSPCIREAYSPYTYEAQQQNLNKLKEKVKEAKDKLTELEKQDTGVAVLNKEAVEWKSRVKERLQKVEKRQIDLERSIEATCTSGCLPNYHRRHAAKRSIQKEYEKVDRLLKSYLPVVKGYRRPQNNTVQRTRGEEIQKIWECLSQREEVKVVCIHGAAFVGKTAIAEAICNIALLDKEEIFGYAIWVDVEFGCQLESLQKKILRVLNVDIVETDDDEDRALKIRDEFVRRKKCLVIIDSLWEDFTLRDIGIPEEVEVEGMVCKVILTSRSPLTCPRIQKDEYFEIKPLSQGWTFFNSIINRNLANLEGEAEDLVKKAVEVCEGSPPEIIKLASRVRSLLQGQSSSDIISPLKEILCSQTRYELSTDTHTLNRLEFSYKRLESSIYQQCFLYCALYPKRYPIEVGELIDNWMWEGLLGNYHWSLEEKRKQGRKVVLVLKSARLLEKADSDGTKDRVKMPSLCHDMAMNIMYKKKSKDFINSGNDLTEFSIDDQNGEIKRASFMHNKLGALKNQPNCPNLTTLLLCNNPLKRISDNFFTRMLNLKILDLSHTKIFNLPSSICHLKLLQVLQLCHCLNLRSLPSLSNLIKLLVLELFGTPLEQLPSGMDKLESLERLNLSHTKLTKFPIGLVSALKSLQELLMLMDNAEAYSWRSKESRLGKPYVEELACLESLRVLELNFYNKAAFEKYMQAISSTMPPNFKFCVGGFVTYGNLGDNSIAFIDEYPDDNQLLPEGTLELYMHMCNMKLTPNNTLKNSGIIFDKLKVLHLSNCSGFTYLFSFEMLDSLQNLERLCASDCWSIVGIIEPKSSSSIDPPRASSCCLKKLQELVLIDLLELRSICLGQLTLEWPAFRRFSIWNCDKLKRLPNIVSKVGENPKRIQLRGKNLTSMLDNSSQFKLEESEIPEEIVTFSANKQEANNSPMGNDVQASFFKRKATEKTRTAALLSENENIETPPRSPGYIERRLDAATGLIRSVQRSIGVLFIK